MNDRIANAFRCPSALTDDDITEMIAIMKKSAAQANKRRKRLENAGGADGTDQARSAVKNLAYRQRRAELRKQKLAAE